ncbi:helicase associated domain-containing protein, partial [Streptomyces sp900105245]
KLAEIDADWRPAWPVDWQRAYAGVAQLLALGSMLGEIVPGVTADGVDVGRWLERQRQHVVWQGLAAGQRERLAALGVEPLPAPQQAPAKASRGGSTAAFGRGCAALARYKARTGSVTVPRGHVEALPDGTLVKLGCSCPTRSPDGPGWVPSSCSSSPHSGWCGRRSRAVG